MAVLACQREQEVALRTEVEQDVLAQYLNLPETPYPYSSTGLPGYLIGPLEAAQDNQPEDNLITDHGATLGRVLFYDKNLSLNNTISCASCHQQVLGFSDTARFSVGLNGELTHRHSMGLTNARYYTNGRFFWDERAATLEEQVLVPIEDPIEMDLALDSLEKRLSGLPYYPVLFYRAFGDSTINQDRIARAMAQFIRSIVSVDSKYDEGVLISGDPQKPFFNFTEEENLGKAIFHGSRGLNCSGCHGGHTFSADNPRSNGIISNDIGAYAVTGIEWQRGAFKAPSLKNIAVRPPYMHNGSMPSLEAVIEHYNSGLGISEDFPLDLHLINNGQPIRMNLTEDDKQALLAFLHTLTDPVVLESPMYSDPFPR
ncbi:MAG: cytochrome-c peroxidase [Leptolyngbya sp. SIO3F4]|nr:cytochrome-c peroxidase [Leptolyngbya sp. SIO3F4]